MNPFTKFQTICLIILGMFIGAFASARAQSAAEKQLDKQITSTCHEDVSEVVQKTKAEWRRNELKEASARAMKKANEETREYSPSPYRIQRPDLPGFTPAQWPDEGGAIEVENPEIYIDMGRLEGEITITVLYFGQCEKGDRCICDCYFSRTFTDEEFLSLFRD